MQNLAEFIEKTAKEYKGFPFLEIKRGFRTERYTYDQINILSKKVASYLKLHNIRRGDRIVIWADNSPEWVICLFGVLRCGGVVVPIDAKISWQTAKKYISQTKPKLLCVSSIIKLPACAGKKNSIVLEEIVGLVDNLEESKNIEIHPDELAEILFTSGTTGFPKGVMLTHKNILSSIDSFRKSFTVTSDMKVLSILPLSHIFEQVVGLFMPFQGGARVFYLTQVNSATIFRAIRHYHITIILVVPRILELMLSKLETYIEKQNMKEIYDMLLGIAHFTPFFLRRYLFLPLHLRLGRELQLFVCGAAPLDEHVGKTWDRMGFLVYQGYGSTETTAVTAVNLGGGKRIRYAGIAARGITVKIGDDGEILVMGNSVSSGYWKDTTKTQSAFSHGWYKTGDIGRIDDKKWIYLYGREKFRIVLSDGSKVYPEDIERQLNLHPKVKDSCVIGITEHQEKVVHAVLLTDYPQLAHEIIEDANKHLESHQKILGFSIWPEKDFPRLRTLKVDRISVEHIIISHQKPYLRGNSVKKEHKSKDALIEILARITESDPLHITNQANLLTDLHLDSLRKVDLTASLEEEFDATIDESKITETTSVEQLRKLIEQSETVPEKNWPSWPKWNTTVFIRNLIQQAFLFPYHALFVPLAIIGGEKLENISDPAIFYINHVGSLDMFIPLRILSSERRKKMMIASGAQIWENRIRGFFIELLVNGYSFSNTGTGIRDSLEYTAEILNEGYSLLVAPEGITSPDGNLLPFRNGIGLLAVETGLDVIGIKIQKEYRDIFPDLHGSPREWIPRRRQKIVVTLLKPMRFSRNVSYDSATKQLENALRFT